MASNPLGSLRRRLGRAIDWRVRTALDQRVAELGTQLAADRSAIESTLASQQRKVDDALEELDVNRVKFAKIEQDELDSLRTLLRELSIGIADQQRAQSELLQRLDRRVRQLEASPTADDRPADG